ncbi:response regulator [bacterium]|nr:response regulator [bacterium]
MQKKILVVDDDALTLETIGEFLSSKGYKLFLARTGSKAVQIARKEKLDATILDVNLPDMDGFAVLEEIRRLSANLPAIMMSAKNESECRARSLELGANFFLPKPVKLSLLEWELREIFQEGVNR